MKQSPLRSDPDKTRAWQERSRAALAQDPDKGLKTTKPLERKTPLRSVSTVDAQGREGMRSTAIRSVVPAAQRKRAEGPDPAQQDKRPLTMAEALRVPFKAKRPARTQRCQRCNLPLSARPRAETWHHWVPQSLLRVAMRGYAQHMGWSPERARKLLASWLRDERNLTPMCGSCHDDGEHTGSRCFYREEVPERAWQFARALDRALGRAGRPMEMAVRLERYPTREERDRVARLEALG